MANLQDKTAVVTGASRGIGRASALALAREGANVVITARNEAELKELSDELEKLGVRSLVVAADLSQDADIADLKTKALETFDHIDILVNNAGVGKYGPFDSMSAEDYDWMMDTNVRSTILCTRAFLPEMLERESGSVITVSSQAGLHGFGNEAIYCATKFAQVGFCQALDHEVRERGVKVSVIAPGGVHTSFAIGTGREEGEPYLDEMLEAEDVADAVVFAAKQPANSRVMLIGMRPMSEPIF